MKFSELIEARRSVRRYAKATQWMPAEGECDLATASVSVAVCAQTRRGSSSPRLPTESVSLRA